MSDLNGIREQINEINGQMLELFIRRMELSEQVAEAKRECGAPLLDKIRERAILAEMTGRAGKLEPYVFQFFTTMFELSKAHQSELYSPPTKVREQIECALRADRNYFPRTGTIACQGTEGGNSQAACDKLFPRGNIVYVKTFDAVFNAVESGMCKYGVLPIENSSNGSVRAVYKQLQRHNFTIIRSTDLCIRHELLVKPGVKLEDIREIYSHEQALGQCSTFIESLGNRVKALPCANTAIAAQMVAESSDTGIAAICSHQCAELYGLECINDNIQNSANNYTQFICITKEPVIYAGANRISLIIGCANRSGALNEILSKLSAYGVNMSKLESCPVIGSDFEFIFFLEIEASVEEPGVLAMLEELERCCDSFTFLGNYAVV